MKRLKTSLVLLLLISFTSISIAAPGKYKQVEQGDTVPFAGWCFDRDASAQILADKELQGKQCKLKTDRALQIQFAKYNLELGKLKADLTYEVGTRDTTIEAMKKENLKLEDIIVENTNQDWYFFSSVGFIVGSLTAIVLVELTR
tara:strand:+ start:691 stop:1125 length:435 start_codon:yes stop_codon:yes gene_type:complete